MRDFVRAPILKKLNRGNYATRIEKLERLQTPTPSATVGLLGELSDDLGDVGRGQLQARMDGIVSVVRLNRILLFEDQATPTITLPNGCLTGSNIVEVILTGQLFQATGGAQTITPSFYIGISGSETAVTSGTSLSIASLTARRCFMYTLRVSAAPQNGNYVQCDEVFQVETATAGVMTTIMRSTRSTNIIDVNDLGDVNSCFIRITNGATPTFFKIFTSTVSVRILDAEPTDEIQWYVQPLGTDSHDTFIASNSATTNYGAALVLDVGENKDAVDKWRTLIRFDDLNNFQTDPDLAGFQVTSASIFLTVAGDFSNNIRTFEVFRLLTDFVDSQATWNIRKTATNWGAAGLLAGTDYDATAMGSVSMLGSETIGVVKNFSLNAAEVQKFIDGTYTNYGFFIKAQTESNDGYQFHSSASATPDFAPILYIIGYKDV